MRLDGQRAGQVDPLLHPARQLRGIAVAETGQSDQIEQFPRAFAGLTPLQSFAQLQSIGDVVDHLAPWQQAGLLEHHGPVGSRARDVVAIEAKRAAVDGDEPGDGIEERRLAATRRADDADEVVARDVEAGAIDCKCWRVAGVRTAVFDPNPVGFEMRGLWARRHVGQVTV